MGRSQNLWKTGLFNVVFQVIFLLVLYIVGSDVSIHSSGWRLILFDMAIVAIPCAVWSFFFYLQDRVEPEPTQYVLVSIFVGMALSRLIGIPLERTVVQTGTWLYTSTSSLILGSIFFVGILHSSLFYLGIRYGFYPSKEFDEPVDGVVYGAFIGSGYAAMKSFTYILSHSGMTLFAIAYLATTNILIYASIASLVGFFIGKAKFGHRPRQSYFLAGLLLSSVLIGLHEYLTDFVLVQGAEGGFLLSFVLTLIFAGVILGVVYIAMRRLTSVPAPPEGHGDLRPDWLVFAVVILFFAVGGITRANALRGAEYRNEKYRLAFFYPHSLVPSSSQKFIRLMDDNVFAAENLNAAGRFKSQYALAVRAGSANLDQLDPLAYVVGAMQPLSIIGKEAITVGGAPGVRLKYSYMQKLDAGWFPELVLVYADVVPKGDHTFIFSLQAGRQNFDAEVPSYSAMLHSVIWN